MNPTKPNAKLTSGVVVVLLLVGTMIVATRHARNPPQAVAATPAAIPTASKPSASPEAGRAPGSSDVIVLRPLPVSIKTERHEWTAGDTSSPEIIEKIAHNPDEFIRLVEENKRIKRRQLVYRRETVPMLLDRARDTKQPLQEITLPGLDGHEIEVEITETHLNPTQQGGSVSGRIKGRFNSMVSVGFAKGYESFNILSPEDHLYLTADAREPGEVIVKEIDPDQYAPAGSDEPDFVLPAKSVQK
jgi:hypothetical protein